MSVQLDIEAVGVVPVIVIDDPVRAADTATALSAGGIGCAEITLRTLDALAAIEEIAARYPDFVIGAGTVITEIQVDAAVDAGASFIVSPGLDEGVIRRARERSVPVVPGVATATEIQRAIGLGLDRLKFFPAGSLGGVGAIRAFGGPFPDMRFLPSGGVSPENAEEYLRESGVFAISGSWMASRTMIRDGQFAEIEAASRAVAESVARSRVP